MRAARTTTVTPPTASADFGFSIGNVFKSIGSVFKGIGNAIGGFFKGIGEGLKSFFNAFLQILPFILTILSFIPVTAPSPWSRTRRSPCTPR